jgi:hypothetical protein
VAKDFKGGLRGQKEGDGLMQEVFILEKVLGVEMGLKDGSLGVLRVDKGQRLVHLGF